MVHETFEQQIEQFKLHGGGTGRKKGEELDELTSQKLKQECIKARHDLDISTKQITGLQQELQTQQRFYDMELKKALQSHRMAALGSDRDTLDVNNMQARSRQLETKLLEALTERD